MSVEDAHDASSDDGTRDPSQLPQPLPIHWLVQFRARRLTRRFRDPPLLSEQGLAERLETLGVALESSRGTSTWSALASVHNQFQAWDRTQAAAHQSYVTLEPDSRMVLWHHDKMERGEITGGTPAQYAKLMHQLYRRMYQAASPLIRDYQRSLVRRGHNLPSNPARPITFPELQRAITLATTWKLKLHIAVQWILAARTNDMQRLKRNDLETLWLDEAQTRAFVKVTWTEGTKKGMLPVVDYFVLPNAIKDKWLEYMEYLEMDQRPFTATASMITAILRQVDITLSSHSLKKGALVELIHHGVPLAMVARKAKHDNEYKSLRAYIGEDAYARAAGAYATAEALEEIWDRHMTQLQMDEDLRESEEDEA